VEHSVPVLGGGVAHVVRHAALRGLMDGSEPVVLPGVFDALTGVLAERAGFEVCYLTGAGVANMQLGMPDVGLVGIDTVVQQAARVAAATTIPIIADGDAGFGGPVAVMNLVRSLEVAGVSGVQLEDQQMPKRCGHFDGKQLIPKTEMQAKIEAATIARQCDDVVIIARTDALALEGLQGAIERARGYCDAGADAIFVEAPADAQTIEAIPSALPGVPLVLNIVPGGRTPELAPESLAKLGYRFHLHANLLLRSMVATGISALEALKASRGRSPDLPFLSWSDRQAIVRLSDFDRIENELFAKWDRAKYPPSLAAHQAVATNGSGGTR
jgi:2-methylisocitrate lyase-like PEP mutase family enzyme